MSIISRPIAAVLSALLVLGNLRAQTPVTDTEQTVRELHLRVVEGGGAEFKPGTVSDKPLTVEVTDQAGAPVPSVAVLFRLPDEGATGVFPDGTRVSIAYSDMRGQATVRNIRWGSDAGPAVLRVTATKGIAHAGVLIEQTLVAGTTQRRSGSTVPPAQIASSDQHLKARENTPPTAGPATPKAPEPAQIQLPQTGSEPPAVIVTSNPKQQIHSGNKKWLWIALIGVGAAAGGFAAVGKSHSTSAATPSQPSVGIGPPSVSIGHP